MTPWTNQRSVLKRAQLSNDVIGPKQEPMRARLSQMLKSEFWSERLRLRLEKDVLLDPLVGLEQCWLCLSNTRLLLSAVMTNSQQCGKWLFSFTCDGKQSFSTLLAICHHCWQKQPVFDKQSQHCMCRQLCARPGPKGSERTCYSSRGVVSVGSVGSKEPTDFWKVWNGTHGFWGKVGSIFVK